MAQVIRIEVWSDIACPFCYIGKRRFAEALRRFDGAVEVEWKSFQLDPGFTPTDATMGEYLQRRKGWSEEQARQANEHVMSMARESGLDMDPSRAVPANTFEAHRLLHLAREKGAQEDVQERLFNAYFVDHADVSDRGTLLDIAEEAGITRGEAEEMLLSGRFSDAVRSDMHEAQALGAGGVPFFVLDRKYAVSGAQPVDIFLQALERARKDQTI